VASQPPRILRPSGARIDVLLNGLAIRSIDAFALFGPQHPRLFESGRGLRPSWSAASQIAPDAAQGRTTVVRPQAWGLATRA
jgi:hypothetical protein